MKEVGSEKRLESICQEKILANSLFETVGRSLGVNGERSATTSKGLENKKRDGHPLAGRWEARKLGEKETSTSYHVEENRERTN